MGERFGDGFRGPGTDTEQGQGRAGGPTPTLFPVADRPHGHADHGGKSVLGLVQPAADDLHVQNGAPYHDPGALECVGPNARDVREVDVRVGHGVKAREIRLPTKSISAPFFALTKIVVGFFAPETRLIISNGT